MSSIDCMQFDVQGGVRKFGMSLSGAAGAVLLVCGVFGCVEADLPASGTDAGDVSTDSASGPGGCTPGATQSCKCSADEEGVQRCNANGTAWSTCDCSGGGGSDTGVSNPPPDAGSDAEPKGDTDSAPDGCEPRDELCDGRDNDCDGETDENLTSMCANQQGVCAGSTRSCENGTLPECADPEYGPDYEINETSCDGLDNDCNGQTDENCDCMGNETQECGKSEGACEKGTQQCSGGVWGECMGNTEPSQETCNGKDDNCDGSTDENLKKDCQKQQGVCQGAQKTCSGGSYPTCDATQYGGDYEQDETKCDGLDNDCDGDTDENLTGSQQCPKQDGVCSGSVETCSSGSYSCGPAAYGSDYDSTDDESAAGLCDGLDNDCDGTADEFCPCNYMGNSNGVCGSASRDANGDCQEPADYNSTDDESAAGLCDGLDNDCDGDTDEGGNTLAPGESCSTDCECRSGFCKNGVCAHRIFATDDDFDGDFNGLSGADSECQNAANNAGLSGTWVAVMSDSSNGANDRISVSSAVYNMNGEKVADSESDLWSGSIDNPVKYNENGNSESGDAWTGATSTGGIDTFDNCQDWFGGTNRDTGNEGDIDEATGDWLDDTSPEDCSWLQSVYCISQ